MIELTRLNGSHLAINCDLIKYAEAAPDTVLTLITGEKLVVLEPCSEVSQRTLNYRAAVLRKAWPEAASSLSAKCGYDADERVRDQARNPSAEYSTSPGIGDSWTSPASVESHSPFSAFSPA